MKKIILSFFIIISICTALHATAQFPDILIYNGTEYSLMSNPLESYFTKNNPRPDKLFPFTCTANWRGYVATWKIDAGKLYLVKVAAGDCSSNPRELDVTSIFGKKLPVEAAWFSGILRIPQGKLLSYMHMGYGSVYEKDLILTIRDGKVISEETKTNSIQDKKDIKELLK